MKNIPYTFHWGKLNNLNDTRLRNMYGASRDKWINARNFLLPPESINLFNSDMLHQLGLDEVVVNHVV